LAKGQLNKVASEEARVAATEKARLAEEEKVRLAAEGAKQAEQAKAAAQAKAAEQARVAAEKARQHQQEKVTAAEQARAAAEKVAADKIAAQKTLQRSWRRKKLKLPTLRLPRKLLPKRLPPKKVSSASAKPDLRPEQQVASLPPADNPAAKAAMSATEIARSVQIELRRVGCLTGSVDGEWTSPSRRALELFDQRAARSSTPNWQALTRSMRLKPRLHGSVPWLASVATRLMEITASKSPAARAHMLTMRMSARKLANDRLDLK
jgi:hypothetical protein